MNNLKINYINYFFIVHVLFILCIYVYANMCVRTQVTHRIIFQLQHNFSSNLCINLIIYYANEKYSKSKKKHCVNLYVFFKLIFNWKNIEFLLFYKKFYLLFKYLEIYIFCECLFTVYSLKIMIYFHYYYSGSWCNSSSR